eukprot:2443695-Pyramimonas_sp.AAC.1
MWGSHEISESDWTCILGVIGPIEVGQPPYTGASRSGEKDFWARVSERSGAKAKLIGELMIYLLRHSTHAVAKSGGRSHFAALMDCLT